MAQFHVYRNPVPQTAERAPYLLDVQSDLVNINARVIVLLVEPSYFGARMQRLNPLLSVNGKELVMSPNEIGAILSKRLGASVADLRSARSEIMTAMDFLLNGF